MTDETLRQRAESIFNEALDLPVERRESFVRERTGGDDALLREVETLLHNLHEAGTFLEPGYGRSGRRFGASRGPAYRPGDRIGPYHLLSKLGEGGMGVVFLAEQTEPVRRRVALKVIKPGMDSDAVVTRFEAERQALALMDHPCIARVIDAGATEARLPYFAMEHVRGAPITDFCERNRLGVRDRLLLFAEVCDAVQHAHQKGVIHRDIKPTNILVETIEGRPTPKIIDFGIAKALGVNLTERTLFTAHGQLVGTLEYMSPEQAHPSGLDIDTRSDIYSLGVLLYELLTGSLPFESEEGAPLGMQEFQRLVATVDPPKPSARLSSLATGARTPGATRLRTASPLRSVARDLRGDLDWITMRALEKDRARRYSSAHELADDVRRHLANQPVVAGPPSAAYRARKFYRRNRVFVHGACVVALVGAVGVAATAWQAVRATRAEKAATAALDTARTERDAKESMLAASLAHAWTLLEDIHKSVTPLAASTDAERTIINAGLRYLESLATVTTDDPGVTNALAEGFERLGRIQGAIGGGGGGESIEAMVSFQKSIALRTALLGRSPGDLELRMRLWISLTEFGRLQYRMRRMQEAVDTLRSALEFAGPRSDTDAERALAGLRRATTLQYIGEALIEMGDFAGAEAALLESHRLRRAALSASGEDSASLRRLSLGAGALGMLYSEMERYTDAAPFLEESLALRLRAAARQPERGREQRDVSLARIALARALLGMGRTDDAAPHVEEALRQCEIAARDDPGDTRARFDLSTAHLVAAEIAIGAQDGARADRHAAQAEMIAIALVGLDPERGEFGALLAATTQMRARAALLLGEHRAALDDALNALRRWEALSSRPGSPPMPREIGRALLTVADALEARAGDVVIPPDTAAQMRTDAADARSRAETMLRRSPR